MSTDISKDVARQVAAEKSLDQLGPDAGQVVELGAPVSNRSRMLGVGTLAVLGTIVLCVVLRYVLADRWTFPLEQQDTTTIQDNLTTWPDWVTANQNSNPFFTYFVNYLQIILQHTADFLSNVFYETSTGLGIPYIGWLGTTVLVTYLAYALGNVKVAALTFAVYLLFVLQNLWPDAMATFAQVLSAVFFSFLIGIPLGIWAGTSDRVNKIVTPVLDFLQIMPAFAYLAPLVLIFGLGSASAVAATLAFAVPPVVRITAHGIRQVPVTTREAVDSLGATPGQRLRTVLIPMSKRTIVIGINQTTMAALSMVTIASFIGAPGLGLDVSQALQSLDVGAAFNAGLAIVLMAIVFDRVTTAASVRAELAARAGTDRRRLRLIVVLVGLVITVAAIYLSRSFLWAAQPPTTWPDFQTGIQDGVNSAAGWLQTNFSFITYGIRNAVSYGILNPFESLLGSAPWFAVGLVFVTVAWVAGGWKIAVTVVVGVVLLIVFGLWADAMDTLAATLLAALGTMILAVVVGVWMGRSKLADRLIRPILDAGQTMPPFVYLIPFLGLFGSSRFTAIVAALVYAAPPAIKIIADGISQVPVNTVEAARSSGATSWQMISKVQVPMSIKAIALASNQAVIYTLSMVVIGGAVGAGALGYDVINGLDKQTLFFGKGLAAGLTLVVLGIMLDRITQAAAQRSGVHARKATERVQKPGPTAAGVPGTAAAA